MPLPLILSLDDPHATLELVGGKGASLARLSRAGLPVPPGFYVTTEAYRRFVSVRGLQTQILQAVSGASPGRPQTLEEASSSIRRLFAESTVPEDVAQAIAHAYANLGGEHVAVAVRSSATAEDLPGMSFAGQLDTFLNISGIANVMEAVQRCWPSLWTARAIGYRALMGVADAELSLAVVVQKLVPAEAAGIAFTADPVTGNRSRVLINAAWGLGEAVVSGLVTPDTIVVDKAKGSVTEQQVQQKEVMTVRAPEGTREEPVPAARRARAALSPRRAAELARLSLKIESLYGQPMDIEWAFERNRFFILQARPITTLHGHNPQLGEWNDSLGGDYLWTNANYGEAVPDVMTPCTWSLVQILLNYADPSIGPYHQYGNIGGRLYANLSTAASIAAAVGIRPKRFAEMVADGFGRLPEGVEIPTFAVSRLGLLGELPSAVRDQLFRMQANLKRLPAFLAASPDQCQALRDRIREVTSPEELVTLWERELYPFMIDACRMLAAAANQGGGAILFLRKKLQKLTGEQDADALLTSSTGPQGPLSSLEPLLGLTQLANGTIDRQTYARQFGHRGPHEVEVSTPRPAEDPSWIEMQLTGLNQAKEVLGALLDRQGNARQAALDRLRRRFPRQEAALLRQINSWTRIAHEREAVRSEVVRAFWVLRAFVQRAGALSGQAESIFFLSIQEILALLGGDPTAIPFVPARRAAYLRYCALPPYPTLIRGQFDPFQWAADPNRRSDFFDAARGRSVPAGTAVIGFPGATGVIEARARVIPRAEEGGQLQPGEVLVTTVTNVGWTPLFPRAAAVVTDVGAPLSHAAIVARELGIPAVVGCGNATMRLHTGDMVRVDGGRGTVEILQLVQ